MSSSANNKRCTSTSPRPGRHTKILKTAVESRCVELAPASLYNQGSNPSDTMSPPRDPRLQRKDKSSHARDSPYCLAETGCSSVGKELLTAKNPTSSQRQFLQKGLDAINTHAASKRATAIRDHAQKRHDALAPSFRTSVALKQSMSQELAYATTKLKQCESAQVEAFKKLEAAFTSTTRDIQQQIIPNVLSKVKTVARDAIKEHLDVSITDMQSKTDQLLDQARDQLDALLATHKVEMQFELKSCLEQHDKQQELIAKQQVIEVVGIHATDHDEIFEQLTDDMALVDCQNVETEEELANIHSLHEKWQQGVMTSGQLYASQRCFVSLAKLVLAKLVSMVRAQRRDQHNTRHEIQELREQFENRAKGLEHENDRLRARVSDLEAKHNLRHDDHPGLQTPKTMPDNGAEHTVRSQVIDTEEQYFVGTSEYSLAIVNGIGHDTVVTNSGTALTDPSTSTSTVANQVQGATVSHQPIQPWLTAPTSRKSHITNHGNVSDDLIMMYIGLRGEVQSLGKDVGLLKGDRNRLDDRTQLSEQRIFRMEQKVDDIDSVLARAKDDSHKVSARYGSHAHLVYPMQQTVQQQTQGHSAVHFPSNGQFPVASSSYGRWSESYGQAAQQSVHCPAQSQP